MFSIAELTSCRSLPISEVFCDASVGEVTLASLDLPNGSCPFKTIVLNRNKTTASNSNIAIPHVANSDAPLDTDDILCGDMFFTYFEMYINMPTIIRIIIRAATNVNCISVRAFIFI